MSSDDCEIIMIVCRIRGGDYRKCYVLYCMLQSNTHTHTRTHTHTHEQLTRVNQGLLVFLCVLN